ncbi:6238_t:CDS:2, partial [Racocetra persica]
ENTINQFDYIINNNDIMNNNNSLDNLYINNGSSFNDLSPNDQDTEATNKDKQSSIKLDDLSSFNFEGLPEETISNDPQVQQVLYHFNCLVKAIKKGQSQSSKKTFLVQIPVFKG